LLERLVCDMQAKRGVWFARGAEIARWFTEHPAARREVDLDVVGVRRDVSEGRRAHEG
jgi:hypothetical protein